MKLRKTLSLKAKRKAFKAASTTQDRSQTPIDLTANRANYANAVIGSGIPSKKDTKKDTNTKKKKKKKNNNILKKRPAKSSNSRTRLPLKKKQKQQAQATMLQKKETDLYEVFQKVPSYKIVEMTISNPDRKKWNTPLFGSERQSDTEESDAETDPCDDTSTTGDASDAYDTIGIVPLGLGLFGSEDFVLHAKYGYPATQLHFNSL